MMGLTYQVVEHDGGWAYKLGDVFSEAFPNHDSALKAARKAAAEQRVPGQGGPIEYQDARGVWHVETSSGADRPSPDVVD